MSAGEAFRRADLRGVLRLRALPHAEPVDRLLAASSRATDRGRGWQALAATGILLDRPRRRRWIVAAVALVVCEELTVALKRRLPRGRPQLAGLPPLARTPSPRSFPSSHTANAIVAAHTLDGIVPAPLLWSFAAVTAFSRCYLGVHYPSDVVAGAALGQMIGRAARRATRGRS